MNRIVIFILSSIMLVSCSKTAVYIKDTQHIKPYEFNGVLIISDKLIDTSYDKLNITGKLTAMMKKKWGKNGITVLSVNDLEVVKRKKDSDKFMLLLGSVMSDDGQESGEFTTKKTKRVGRGKNYSLTDYVESVNWQKNTKNINTVFHFIEISDETKLVASSNVVSRFSNLQTKGNQGTEGQFTRTEYDMKDDSRGAEILGNINAALKGSFLNILSSSKSVVEEVSAAYVEVEFKNIEDVINQISDHHTKQINKEIR